MNGNSNSTKELVECLKIGLLHIPSGRYLTAEVFNNEINISGTALRRRQVWTLLIERGNKDVVCIQNNLGRFLSTNKDGKISAVSKQPGTEERFRVEFSPDGTGEWAFRSDAYGFYLTGSDTQVSCFSKPPVWWAIRLAIHPQVHIRHQFRVRYLRLLPDGTEIRADQPYPWGPESLIWLEQLPMGSGSGRGPATPIVGRASVSRLGRIAFRTQTGQYLKPDGTMANQLDDSVLFTLEFRPGHPCTFAFRDSTGAYLTTIGPGTWKSKSSITTPGKEELFLIEHGALQVGILAHNGKFASVKQGVEISANQHELDETALFQLEYLGGKGFNVTETIAVSAAHTPNSSIDIDNTDTSNGTSSANGQDLESATYVLTTGFWRLRSRSGKLWQLASSSGVKNTASDGDPTSLFEILTLNKRTPEKCGLLVIRSNSSDGSGQSLTAKKLGAISTSGRRIDETIDPIPDELFRIVLRNRPSLALLSALTGTFLVRGKQNALDCSGVVPELFEFRVTRNHTYQLFARNPNSSYMHWAVGSNGALQLEPTDRSPDEESESECINPRTEFMFHFLGHSRIAIQPCSYPISGLSLVRAEMKGEVKLDLTHEIIANHIWEI